MYDPATVCRILESSERVLEDYAEDLFTKNRMGCTYSRDKIPLIGGAEYPVEGPYFREKEQVVEALQSQQICFRRAPGWAPRLPLSPADIDEMAHDPDPRHRVVAMFAKLLRASGWHASKAYGFGDFVRTLLADPRTPADIRNHRQLQKDFPPPPAWVKKTTANRI